MSLIDDIMEYFHGSAETGRLMPRGSHHVLTGVLRSGRGCFELHVEGGGYWFIDPPSWGKARGLVGKRVIVRGTKAGFNLLNAARIVDATDLDADSSGSRKAASPWARLVNRLIPWHQ